MTPTDFLTEALPLCERAGIETGEWERYRGSWLGPPLHEHGDSYLASIDDATDRDMNDIAWRMWRWYCEQTKDRYVIEAVWGHAPLLADVRAELDRQSIDPTPTKSSPIAEGDPDA